MVAEEEQKDEQVQVADRLKKKAATYANSIADRSNALASAATHVDIDGDHEDDETTRHWVGGGNIKKGEEAGSGFSISKEASGRIDEAGNVSNNIEVKAISLDNFNGEWGELRSTPRREPMDVGRGSGSGVGSSLRQAVGSRGPT